MKISNKSIISKVALKYVLLKVVLSNFKLPTYNKLLLIFNNF